MKGNIKETAGKVTNNPNLQAEGNAEKNTGKVGQIERAFESKLAASVRTLFERAMANTALRNSPSWNCHLRLAAKGKISAATARKKPRAARKTATKPRKMA